MGIQINGTNDTITTNDGTISIDGGTTITGSLTGTTGVFSGDVGVAGTLTSEDKTNIDSVGLITARTGIKIGPITGVAATHYADGSIRTTGIITATSFVGGITGTSGAFSSSLDIADKIRHTGDTDTSIRFPSADTITLETGGSERMRLSSAGRLMIGSDVSGHAEGDDLTIATSSITGITVRSGTSSPGNIFFSDGTSGNAERMGIIRYDHNGDYMMFGVNYGEKLRIDSSGNIGQGSATPTTPNGSNADNPNNGLVFTMYGDSPAINLVHNVAGGSAAADDYAAINFGRTGSSTNPYRAVIGYKQSTDALHINTKNYIRFDTGGDINSGERLRITSSGNLLIGATAVEDWDSSRSHYLQIRGATYQTAGMSILDTQNDDNPGEIVLGKSRGTGNTIVQSADDVGQIRWSANDGNGFHSIAHIRCSMDGTTGNNDLPSKLTFATCGDGGTSVQEAMRIDSNGYIHQDRMPVFHANGSPSRDGDGFIHSFSTVHTNIGSCYNNGNGKFTAPVNGIYYFSFTAWCNDGNANDSTGTFAGVAVYTSSGTHQRDVAAFNVMPGNSASSSLSASSSGVAYMNSGNYARLSTQFSIRGSTPRNAFCGFLLHAT